MPRIPDYQSRATITPQTSDVMVPLGPAVAPAEAAAQFGSKLADVSSRFGAQIRHADDLDFVLNVQTQASQRWTQYKQQAEQSAPPGARGYTDQAQKWWEEQSATLLQNAPTEEARDHAQRYLVAHMDEGIKDAARFESTQRLKYYTGNAENYISELSKQAYRNPALIDYNASLAEAAIEAGTHPLTGWWPASLKPDLLVKAKAEVAKGAFIGLVEKNPTEALSQIREGKWDQWFDTQSLDTLTRRAERDADHFNSAGKVLLQESMKSALTQMETTGTAPANIVGEVERVYGPEHGILYANQMKSAASLYNFAQETSWLSPEQVQNKLETMKPMPGDPDYHNKYQTFSMAQQRSRQLRKEYDQDPVAYVSSSPMVVRSPKEQRNDAVLAVQRSMGSREDQLKIMDNQTALSVVAQFDAATGSQRIEAVNWLKNTYGPHWDMAVKDLVATKKFDPVNQVLTNISNPAVAPVVATAIDQGEKVLKEVVGSKVVKEVDDAVMLSSAEWFKTHALSTYDGARSEWASKVLKAVTLTAYVYAQRGIRPADAANRAVEEILTGDLHPIGNGTYLVPKALDKGRIDGYAGHMKSVLDSFSPLYPTDAREGISSDQMFQDYLSSTKRDGYWVNNESGTGLVLMDKRGIPVLNRSGDRYEFTFEDAIKFQPPSPSGIEETPFLWGLPWSEGKARGNTVVAGVDLRGYAADPGQIASVGNLYRVTSSIITPDDADEYIKSRYPDSPITGDMIVKSAGNHDVSVGLMLALLEHESHFGTAGLAVKTKNPGNVGGDSPGPEWYFGDWKKGVDVAAMQLAKRKVKKAVG
jgi:hypothetical protein